MSMKKIPGKTAPRIFTDISLHDPRSKVPYNPFKDPPPGFEEYESLNNVSQTAPRCNHRYTIKRGQTCVDPDTEELEKSQKKKASKVSAICQNCCWHIDLEIRYDHNYSECPTMDFPLHHFMVQKPARLVPDGREFYYYGCTTCHADLTICVRPKRLTAEYHHLLVDRANLQKRLQEAVRKDIERPRLEAQTPIKVLEALSTYLRDSLENSPKMKDIPVQNKRFMTSFGDDCDVLLTWLGFKKRLPGPDDNTEHELWQLPKPPAADPFATETKRILLEDVMEELWASIRKMPEDQKRTIRHHPPEPVSFENDLRSLLGMVEYDKHIPRVRRFDISIDHLYSGLGAIQDFTTELLIFAFKRQTTTDPANSSYYYDCLTAISEKNPSNDMNMELGLLASEGFFSRAEITEAYKYLGFSGIVIPTLTDQDILGHFESRLDSSHKSQETELRGKLKIIGQARGSTLLTNAAENVVQTPEQALKWLDSTYDGTVDVSDDHIIAMAASKLHDRPDHRETIQKAVGILAEHRNSDSLRSYLVGQADYGGGDPIAEAYQFFNIADRTATLNFDVLEALAGCMIVENSNAADVQRHLTVLKNHFTGQSAQANAVEDYENPVGLTNMGNTCYLNCLLQYFFTIRPLREVVLDFDRFKLDTSDSDYQPKRVDSQVISKLQVLRSQEFVKELRTLYRDMTTLPGPVVSPTWRLATLTLETSPNTISNIRRSTIGGEPPVILSPTKSHGQTWHENPDNPPLSTSNPFRNKTANSSEVTLIESGPKTPDTEPDVMALDDEEGDLARVESPTDLTDLAPDPMDPEAMPLLKAQSPPSPPPRPPPVPPRPIGPLNKPDMETTDHEKASKLAAEAAAQQQDVDEAMGNVLFKLQCSIKSEMKDGKPTDVIKELFYGSFLWKYTNKTTEDNNEPFSAINVSLTEKPLDINAGLDGAFAIDDVILDGNRTKRYRTLTNLPPIFQIYIQRQDYDHTRHDTVINKHHIQLNEVIYLDRFITINNSELQSLREQSWAIDRRLSKLKARRQKLLSTSIGIDAPDLLDQTYQFISDHAEEISASDAVLSSLKSQSESRRTDIDSLATEVASLETQKSSLFASHTKYAYVLAAVFVHRGQGGSRGGHYWIFIRDFAQGKWRKYEDRTVSLVIDLNDIFGKTDPEAQGAPYFCVYVKKETRDIFDAVFRENPRAMMDLDEDESMVPAPEVARIETTSVMDWTD